MTADSLQSYVFTQLATIAGGRHENFMLAPNNMTQSNIIAMLQRLELDPFLQHHAAACRPSARCDNQAMSLRDVLKHNLRAFSTVCSCNERNIAGTRLATLYWVKDNTKVNGIAIDLSGQHPHRQLFY
jgi:hypothetical protein